MAPRSGRRDRLHPTKMFRISHTSTSIMGHVRKVYCCHFISFNASVMIRFSPVLLTDPATSA
jgi:hypothetical protein